MILQIIQQILGIILFFLPGTLLSYIIFPKTDIIKRTVFSIVLSFSISIISSIIFYFLNLLTSMNITLCLFLLSIFFILILKLLNRKYKTDSNNDLFYLLFFSLIGSLWKFWFWKSIKNPVDAYEYSYKFIGNSIPDLGFYTGMAQDRAVYIGLKSSEAVLNYLSISNFLHISLITFIFLGFIYIIFSEFRNKKLAFVAVALMSLGPIELFHMLLPSLTRHSLAYISLFPLFLFFKSKNNRIFWLALLLAIAMMFTYYSAVLIMFLASFGFIIALFIKELLKTRNLFETFKNSVKSKKIMGFTVILLILAFYIFIFSNMAVYTIGKAHDLTDIRTRPILNNYKNPSFLGLSAIRWQILFFFLCGLTFIIHIARKIIKKKRISENNQDLLLCLIPILIISYGFIHINLPTRIFDHFAFFGLLLLKIPKKYLRIFFILSFTFLLITGFYVAKDKRVFFEISDGEITGAKELSSFLDGRVFSDMFFINQLISNNYYNVTGANEKQQIVRDLFYQNNPSIFLDTVNTLNTIFGVDYIVLTKRMQEKYILMVNVPQKPLKNINLYAQNLNKVYDNGDVRAYKIKNDVTK